MDTAKLLSKLIELQARIAQMRDEADQIERSILQSGQQRIETETHIACVVQTKRAELTPKAHVVMQKEAINMLKSGEIDNAEFQTLLTYRTVKRLEISRRQWIW